MTLAEKLRAEGSQRLLLRLLHARFPDQVSAEIEARVQTAGEPQLEAWGERVLTATTLDDVFAE